jgi:3-oxoacyl-[acyl-carrier protein] reductase
MMNLELSEKVSLVTGSSRGIGKAIALKLAEMGSKVAVNDIPGEIEISAVAKEIQNRGGEAIQIPGNVTIAKEVKSMTEKVIEKWGKIDILVNNAGITRDKLILRMSEEDWDEVIGVNLRGAFLCSKYCLRSMMGLNWGRIINMASVAGTLGSMGRVNYSSSKGGLIAFTRSLAHEVGPKNITVNAISPGWINTRLTENLPQEAKEFVLSRTVLRRFGKPHEVAELAAFIASDRAGYITGQVIGIDGGIT